MCEFSSNALQIINPNETVIFTETPVPCTRGFVRHRDDTGNFLLSGYVPYKNGCRSQSALYLILFGCNIAVPTGEEVGEISLAVTIDGATIPTSTMIATPSAVEDFTNVGCAVNAQIWRGCCESVAVKNTSDIPVVVQNANLVFSRPDLNVTY